MFVEILIDGLTFGLMLSLLGVGITLIFGLGEILNMAHGEFVIICALLSWGLSGMGVNLLLSITSSLMVTGLIGLAIEKTLLYPAYRAKGETRILMGIFITLGLSLALHSYLLNTVPLAQFSVRVPLSGFYVGGVLVRASSLLSALIATAALALLSL